MSKIKSSPVGCLIYLAVSVTAFVFLPWQVALGITVLSFFIMAIIQGMINEIQRIKLRNITPTSTIVAAREGFVELYAKIKDKPSNLTTWLTNLAADFTTISFNNYIRLRNSEGHWTSFFSKSSAQKLLLITDGSGDAWVSLRRTELDIKSKIKRIKSSDLHPMLKAKPISEFPMENLEAEKTIRIEEKWIPIYQYHYFYGQMHHLDPGRQYKEIVANNLTTDEKQRSLSSQDWEEMVNHAQANGLDKIRFLTSKYSNDPGDVLIISRAGDSKQNFRSYLGIAFAILGILMILAFAYIALHFEFPELLPSF
ncbi:MAG: hypothetical protein JXQ90_15870 [Cyclobacteriaceae bacterium]